MTDERTSHAQSGNDFASAMQQAVRARALEEARQESERPRLTWRDRLPAIGLTVGALLVVVLLINFVVNGLMRIMDIWYPGSISGVAPVATQPLPKNGDGVTEPFMIGVIVEGEATSSASSSASSR